MWLVYLGWIVEGVDVSSVEIYLFIYYVWFLGVLWCFVCWFIWCWKCGWCVEFFGFFVWDFSYCERGFVLFCGINDVFSVKSLNDWWVLNLSGGVFLCLGFCWIVFIYGVDLKFLWEVVVFGYYFRLWDGLVVVSVVWRGKWWVR